MPHTGEAENAFLKSNSVSILTWVVKDDSSFTEVVLGLSPAEGTPGNKNQHPVSNIEYLYVQKPRMKRNICRNVSIIIKNR